MALAALLGQELILSRLCDLVRRQSLPHALLLVDREEIAMGLTLAAHLAGFMHCQNRTTNGMCGECASCQQIGGYKHLDVHYVFPVINLKDKGSQASLVGRWQQFLQHNPYPQLLYWLQEIDAEAKNKQGNISKDACQALLREAELSSASKGGKIFIIWLAEFLGNEGNRLLKIIEEPYPNTFFFLITHTPTQILPTLGSRMQSIYLRPIPESEILNYLTQAKQIPSEKATEIILQAGANMAEIAALLKDGEGQFWELLKLFLNTVFTQRITLVQEFLQALTKLSREEVKAFLGYVMNVFAKALRANYLEGNYAEIILKIKGKMSIPRLEQSLQLLSDYHYYVQRNAEIKLILHSLILQCRSIVQQDRWVAVSV